VFWFVAGAGGPRGVSLPGSHATDHTRYVLSVRSMLIADKGGCRLWTGNPQR